MDLSLIFCNTLNSQALPNCGFSNMHPILPSTHSQISKPCYATSSLEVLKSMLVMQIFGSSPILWQVHAYSEAEIQTPESELDL
ncbi:hypothetical protein QN277_005768 [Acacia crassicarpa]|uniref:Uncharacterized protein n=1 Tax=Acacia crassicarpa TaxID=499986 RepID=A0AAE1J0D1_9FABA|nr:hypothetical protein QN277_005768 [Acacia crassicarpa]